MNAKLVKCGKAKRCSCCARGTWGKQFFNQDKGFGLCWPCSASFLDNPYCGDPKELLEIHGVEGVNYPGKAEWDHFQAIEQAELDAYLATL